MLKGNDYLLIWLLTEPDGKPIDYNQFDSYKVFIQNDSNKSYKYEVETAAIDDGLHFDFKSDMQKSTGYYSLIFEAVKDGRNYKAENYRGIHIDGNVDKDQAVISPSNSTIKLTDSLSLYLGGRDGRSPYVGVNNHWWVFDDVQKAYADTGIKVDYSAEIGAQITLAEQAITRVNQTNQTVSENEIARSQNEAIREQEERTRVANEVERVYDENLRIVNEMKRKEDEAVRISDETTRKDSEATRVNNEATRVSNEDARKVNETSRVSAESTRVSNENTRKSNEADRVSSESARVLAEQSRVAEEIIRVANETKRQDDTAKAIHNANTATESATNAANTVDAKVAEAIKPIEANKLDKSEFDLQRQPVYGLGFKSGDNTVNLKTPEINLGLNDFTVELWARMEGCANDMPKSLLTGGSNIMGVYGTSDSNLNTIGILRFMKDNQPSLIINKKDSTKNLHHIVITRKGTLVTATINGRLIKSVTQDRVLDFSNFVFDIANTTYFSLGRVFNYAMSREEAVSLWNGGRVDEVVLDSKEYNLFPINDNEEIWTGKKTGNVPSGMTIESDNNIVKIKSVSSVNANLWTRWSVGNNDNRLTKVYYSVVNNGNVDVDLCFRRTFGKNNTNTIKAGESVFITDVLYTAKYSGYPNTDMQIISNGPIDIIISNATRSNCKCLLELLPQNIHSSGIYNTGSLGSSHDAVLSKPTETTFIKEKPYKDKQMSTGAPNFHPIAMGQKVYSDTGLIYEAAIPPTSREWSTADWKQVNNN